MRVLKEALGTCACAIEYVKCVHPRNDFIVLVVTDF